MGKASFAQSILQPSKENRLSLIQYSKDSKEHSAKDRWTTGWLVYTLPGAKKRDVTLRLDRFLKLANNNPLMIVHINTNDMASHDILQITDDFKELRRVLKEKNVQVITSEILPASFLKKDRRQKLLEVNTD